jgi:hypothetical protein
MLSPSNAYSAFVNLVMHSEVISWNRFYNYLMAMTFLILAWATLYVQPSVTPTLKTILVSISILGALSGLLWAALGYRGRRFLDEFAKAGSSIENDSAMWPSELDNYKPLTSSRALRDQIRFRYSGSMFLLTCVPLLISVLYLILFCASINR